jgi:hypothetical protein
MHEKGKTVRNTNTEYEAFPVISLGKDIKSLSSLLGNTDVRVLWSRIVGSPLCEGAEVVMEPSIRREIIL